MTLRERLSGLAACLVIVALLAGMPAVLLGVGGNPIPAHLPTFHGLVGMLTSPDDGTLALGALAYAGWLIWVVLAVLLLTEIAAQLRGVQTPDVPGLRLPQLAVRQLVVAAAALFLAAPLVLAHPMPSVAAPPSAAAPHHAGASSQSGHHQASTEPKPAAQKSTDHVVRPGDTLSGLAERYLDDPDLWPEIYDATENVRQPDGRHLTDPDLVVEGWTVRVPHDEVDGSDAKRPVVERHVHNGDTLSGVAETQLGDASRWPEIYRASTDVRQPDGDRLRDPDLIIPGWTLRIPTGLTNRSQESAAIKHKPAPAPRQPAPQDPQKAADGHDARPNPHPSATAPTPSATTAATAGTPAPSPKADRSAPSDVPEPTVTAPTAGLDAPWLLSGLAVGGAVLAGSAYLTLRRRREQQMRTRTPGSSVPRPEPAIRPVEKTIIAAGSVSADAVRAMDELLRELAMTQLALGRPMPQVDSVELTDHDIVLHLTEPADLSKPWEKGTDRQTWLARHAGVQASNDLEQPAPYPLLVTIGTGDDGHIWLLNLEGLGVIDVVGDRTYGDDLLRYVCAELAVNPWSRDVKVACIGAATEVAPMNAERIRTFDRAEVAAAELLTEAEATIARALEVSATTLTGRAAQLADEAWLAQVLLLDRTLADASGMANLLDLAAAQPARSATVVLIAAGSIAATDHHEIHLDDHGRLTVPHLELDLVSVGLTQDEAEGCALLLSQADGVVESTAPESQQGEEDEQTEAPVADDDEDQHGGPMTKKPHRAPTGTRANQAVSNRASDPELDADLADWFGESCERPRLSLLGPVRVRANGRAIAKRKPFYTELLAYLALRENGARPEEVAEAFGLAPPSVRTSIKTVRDWLGVNPRTGERHLPEATRSRGAIARGIAVYQVDDLLVDVDLFERLRRRAVRRGREGIEDLCAALSLVTGRPFDQLRPGGWSWLVDLNVDSAMLCAVVDVAHDLVERFLALDEPARARAAAETALLAAPNDPIPKLDLAAVAPHEGHTNEARRLALEVVRDAEVDGLPADLGKHIEAQVQVLIDQHEHAAGRLAS
ncbi:LysM peptidoglycan-binding domain-containing protein [uncultured Friedmanniella sp.]|uniref:LysM peptidoglycan-binding domain-containing protein n=1 Tax=uncultured Friedmanniella sp. TaxID=335381 RepID=UPI0035CC21AC